MGSSELTFRGGYDSQSNPSIYSPKPIKRPTWVTRIVAAEAVGNAIDRLSERLKMFRNLLDEWATFSGVPVLSVAGSPKFEVYDVDFGIGRPTKVEVVSVAKTGAMSVAESRNEEGGVEIGIAFSKDEMDCFKKYFFDGLKPLSE